MLYLSMKQDVIIYHNPRWGKSRKSVRILDENKVSYKLVKYIEKPLSYSELEILAKKLGLHPKNFIRKGESEFKDLNLSEKLENSKALFLAMSKFPKLIERPIIVNGEKACIGRPPDKILEIL